MGRNSAEGRRNAVRGARRAAELTQTELADAVGVTRQTIASIEAGNYAPSVYLALAIAHRLGGTVEALFAGVPAPPQTGPSANPETTSPLAPATTKKEMTS
ncbi:helix-turn-helix transcriptional regulator [Frankia sp. AgKG'84/4]|uniref:helix-turn-helix transcriptional regulator n=1 Tax=Frankia sp. AgKG'84/4 TaxID=573490 RepID=UPI00200CEC66|nr:helix-turn-helix transcriptional regulator [Frankia sp. AgKG'84/4]MCL9792763.1 helix-turn-helix transcriptional regulator [Frankia sp. AgKG'84/4]